MLTRCGRRRERPATRTRHGRYQDALILKARDSFKPIPVNPPTMEGINATPELVALGKALFFDPRLYATHSISCATCHNPGLGGADNSPFAAGFHGERGGRNSPTVLNAVFNFAQFWDGRTKDLMEHAGGPLVNPVEMASPLNHVTEQILALPDYKPLFAAGYPGVENPVTMGHVQQAIAAYEATLITHNAPFEGFLRGEATALDGNQKAGLALFMDKGCSACHSGVNVGGHGYYPFGLIERPGSEILPEGDKGRFAVTETADDEYVFRASPLRNIALTAPYFHSGKVWDL